MGHVRPTVGFMAAGTMRRFIDGILDLFACGVSYHLIPCVDMHWL